MNFSNTITYSGLCDFSPNSTFLSIVKNTSLIIYSTSTLLITHKFSFPNQITQISWSPDSTLILISFFKNGLCEIRSVTNPNWICSINQSQSGIIFSRWTPDSRKIIITNDFNVRLSIWSLIDKSTVYINGPKSEKKGISFSSNGYFMALAERDNSKDFIGVYFTGDFSLVSRFNVDTFDLNDISWSKDNTSIVVWDSDLECKFLVYSPTGNLIKNIQPYKYGLGIQEAKFSLNYHYFCIGFNDGFIRLYNSITWNFIYEFNHNINILQEDSLVNVFKEEEIKGKNKFSKYKEGTFPFKLSNINFKGIGSISQIEFSFDSTLIASRNDSIPNAVFIWEVNTLKLNSVIVHIKNVKDFKWSPKENILIIVTENEKCYVFSLFNVYLVELVSDSQKGFQASFIKWNNDGKSFIISDKKQMIIGHPLNENNENNNQNLDEQNNDLNSDINNINNDNIDNQNFENEEEPEKEDELPKPLNISNPKI